MKTKTFIGVLTVVVLGAACSSQPKEIVNAPLQLSGASDTHTLTCGSYGCESALREKCKGSDFRILNQDTSSDYNSRKNHTTGVWDSSRTESVEYVFKCLAE